MEAGFQLAGPLGTGAIVDKGLIAHDWDRLSLWIAVLIAGYVAASLAGLMRDRVYARLQGRSLATLRQGMYERLQQLSLAFHSHTGPETVLERFSDDLACIEHAFSMTVSRGILPGLVALSSTVLMLWLDWRVGLLALLFWPWVLLAPRTIARHAAAAAAACEDEQIRILSVVEESLTARRVVRAFSLEHMGISLFRKQNELLMDAGVSAAFLSALGERLGETGMLGLQVLVLLFSAWLSFNFGVSPGAVVSLQLLAIALGRSLALCNEYLPALEQGREAWSRIGEDLTDPEPVLDKSGAKPLPALQNEILLFEIKYTAAEEAEESLAGVTVRIPRGTSAALVGAAGAGQSLVPRLLVRFADPESGIVTFDSQDLVEVTQASIHARVGIVLPENFVFNASLSENIRLGRQGVSEEILKDVAQAAGVQQFASALPKGLETQAGENGVPLDGEAVQRLALARALLRDPDVLVLDRAASALNAAQEASFNATVKELSKNRTLISATHRLSSVSDFDCIFVFEQGKLVEQGKHAELMAADGCYARLWRKQGGFDFSPDGAHVDVEPSRLRLFPILEKLPEDLLAELAPCFATQTFPPERDIVTQNDPGDRFYIVVRGHADAWREDEQSGQSSRIAVLEDGDFFGEITLMAEFPRTATIRTKTVSTCISLERRHFERVVGRYPDLRRELSEVAVQRLRDSGKALSARQP